MSLEPHYVSPQKKVAKAEEGFDTPNFFTPQVNHIKEEA